MFLCILPVSTSIYLPFRNTEGTAKRVETHKEGVRCPLKCCSGKWSRFVAPYTSWFPKQLGVRSVHDDLDRHPVEKSTLLARIRCYLGALDLWTRTSTSSRFTYVLKKKTPRKALFYFFFTNKLSTVIYTEGGKKLHHFAIRTSTLPMAKWYNFLHLTPLPATTTFSLKLVVEWRRLLRFPGSRACTT